MLTFPTLRSLSESVLFVQNTLPCHQLFEQDAAVTAFHSMSSTHYPNLSSDYTGNLIHAYLDGLSSPLLFTRYAIPLYFLPDLDVAAGRMGCCLALGALPRPLLSGSLGSVLQGLLHVASDIEECEPQFTESRRDAVRAISR